MNPAMPHMFLVCLTSDKLQFVVDLPYIQANRRLALAQLIDKLMKLIGPNKDLNSE